ncbi:hypothetical protein XW81_00650 [Buchnera aphidicola (Schlechtendalia chinensis)]|uniref:Large ribosomal subunit protein bL25 n=1 Tax=Buchnera aphidicola subsp. Schlechtendalia chinensis TaxID=118110 RepID=A0A172WD99_BUCSC|nr:50S ribosomal protein L25 [Buchnera aphidicola]ANF16939.1 hypothetical protein XW81_00650 [Buchnera aphidicola (Schlechtendalia chinensis)]
MIIINVVRRKKEGTSSSRRLRLKNKFPAVIYRHLEPNICIELDHNEIFKIISNSNFYEKELIFIIDKIEHKVKIKSIQRHVFKSKILHMDFFKI